METFTELKDFVDNPRYHKQRLSYLGELDIRTIDAPIVDIISGFVKLPYCFTLQSCYGHFLHSSQKNLSNVEPLPISDSITHVEYRIAYIAFCIENSNLGRAFFQDLREIPSIDPEYIQFGCAEWFWGKTVNSYALQVEPKRHMYEDKVPAISYEEALYIEKTRNRFFAQLEKLLRERLEKNQSS